MMLGFQVTINGKPLYTVGIGDAGMMTASIEWARIGQKRGRFHEHLWLGANGMVDASTTSRYWENTPLKIGDEVSIKIVETDAPDPPLPGLPSFAFSR